MVGGLLCIIYLNTLAMARVWVERSVVPEWIGMWWVHALLALFVLFLLVRESGVALRPRPFRDSRERHEPAA